MMVYTLFFLVNCVALHRHKYTAHGGDKQAQQTNNITILSVNLFQLHGSEMRENITLKMGVKFAASLNMGRNLC